MFEKSGQARFNQCAAKNIEIAHVFKDPESPVNAWFPHGIVPGGTIEGKEVKFRATLHCPRTEQYELGTSACSDQASAIVSLGEIAGKAVCDTCDYYKMPPAAVQDVELARHLKNAEIARAKTDAVTAQIEYQKALAELQAPPQIEQ
jgi:hypothetical protein